MLKKPARKLYKEKRKALSPAQRMRLDDLLLIHFQQLNLPFLSSVLSFYPIEEHNEINTFIITDYLQFKNPGLQIAYPKTDTVHNTMQAIICTEETVFEKNGYNIYEPAGCEIIEPQRLDAVLLPMLLFDKQGYRVGYGKGFYDRFLQQCSAACLKIGLSYFEPEEVIEDAHQFDVPLNFCITPQKVYAF
jgi:5-formyltetrahydrofolate cyclo-ligase